MKKYLGIFSAVFALTAISFSCQKAEITDPNAPGTEQTYNKVDVVLTATLESRIGTKVTLDFPNLAWEDQDQIAVFDGKNTAPNVFIYQAPVVEDETTEETNPEEVTPAAVAVKSSVVRPSFSGSIAESAEELYAVYPYNANATLADGKITTTIPHEQVVPEGGNVDKSALLCVAKTTSDALAFKNVLGLVRVVVPKAMAGKFTTITIAGANNETVSGTGAITVSDAPSFEATAAEKQITLTHAKGSFPEGEYYVAVAPVKFEGGFSISFTKRDGKTGTKSTTKTNEVVRNGGLNVDDQLSAMTWEYLITTKEQLFEWNNNYASWTKNDIVKLGASIDLENEPWEPHTFSGIFDGQNNCLYNINCVGTEAESYASFIHILTGDGALKNLIVGSSDGKNYDGKSIFKIENTESVTNWRYAAVVGKTAGNACVENVKNFAAVEVGATDNGKTCIAGICADWNSEGNVKDCVNYGNVENKAAANTDAQSCVAGVVARIDKTNATLSGCYNYGSVTISGAQAKWIGGVLCRACTDSEKEEDEEGNTTTTYFKTIMSDCHNEGTITMTAANGGSCAAGVASYVQYLEMTGCSNKGKISINHTKNSYAGGLMAYVQGTSAVSVSNSSNEGTIESKAVGNHIGGIVGYLSSAATLTINQCSATSSATIDVTASDVANVGGIVGWTAYGTTEISSTSSACTINVTPAKSSAVGGIVGRSASTVNLTECDNTGSVTLAEMTVDFYLGGVIGLNAAANTTLSTCENYGVITSKGGSAVSYVGGVVGLSQNGITMTGCKNDVPSGRASKVNIYTTSTKYPNVGGIVGAFGTAGTNNLTDCVNDAEINHTQNSTGTNYDSRLAGILGFQNGSTTTTLLRCKNDSDGNIVCSGSTSQQWNMGGMLGKATAGTLNITDCENKCNISVAPPKGVSYLGGFVGRSGMTVNIKGGKNTGNLTLTQSQNHGMVGGACGLIEGGTVTIDGVNNSGTIKSVASAYHKSYRSVGGIVGKANKGTIKNCVNTGSIIGEFNTDNQLANCGGIIGDANGACTVSDNINGSSTSPALGAVIAQNAKESTAYAGGIVGGDNEGNTDAATTNMITGNKNYGTVSATGNGVTLTTSGAGGIIGTLRRIPTTFSDNTNYGNVSASGATTNAAGAICGYMESTKAAISSIAYTGLTVNGVAKADASDLNLWLCGSSKGGEVTATYVDAIQ